MIAAVMVCVVETGTPKCVATWITLAAAVSAANPWMGSSLMTLDPSVWMMRQPPEYVPAAMASAQAILTQVGMVNVSIWPLANRASAMMPIVFCASLAPCEKAMNPAEIGCRRRNHLLTGACWRLRTSQMRPVISSHAPTKPRSGEPIIGRMIFSTTPLQMTPSTPALAIMAPMRPPKSACEELDGMPKCQVTKFHTTAPTRAAMTTCRVTRSVSTMPFADGLGDAGGDQGAEQVEPRGHQHRDARGEGARRHRGGDRVGGVVEAVGVVEDERQDDDRDEEDHGLCSGQLCLRTMLSMTLATCSHSSIAASRIS